MAHLTMVPLRNALGRLWGSERGGAFFQPFPKGEKYAGEWWRRTNLLLNFSYKVFQHNGRKFGTVLVLFSFP